MKALKTNKPSAAPLINALQATIRMPDSVDCVSNLQDIMAVAAKTNRTNDSKSFQKTVMMAIASSSMDPEDKKVVSGILRTLALKKNKTNITPPYYIYIHSKLTGKA